MMGAALALVLAFGTPDNFFAPATFGGGEGVSFTGSPTSKWNCSVCHTATGTPQLTVSVVERDLFTLGYVPGETYELKIVLERAADLRSSMALEIARLGGFPSGRLSQAMPLMGNAADASLCPINNSPGAPLYDPVGVRQRLSADGGLVAEVAHSDTCAHGEWRVQWQAPATDEGGLTLYVSAVNAAKDSDNTGDVTRSLVLGIPSPTSGMKLASGCSSSGAGPGVFIVALSLLLFARRRRALVLLAMLPALAFAAPKKKTRPAPPPPANITPTPQPEPAPPPAPAPLVEATPPSKPPEPPNPPKVVKAEAPLVASVPDTSNVPGAFELDARLGFGFRSFTLSSNSYPTPFKVSFGFPSLSLGLTFYPARLMRLSVLSGLHLQGRYAVGWAPQQSPLGVAELLPSDGRVALGYAIRAGVVEITPRALYRIVIGGIERNPYFDDGYFQSLGGELAVGVVTGGFFLHVTPRAGAIVDVGTQMVRGYGASRGGFTWGGSAEVGWRFSPFFQLSGTYQLTVARTQFAGQGERGFEAMTLNDTVHAGYLVLTLEH